MEENKDNNGANKNKRVLIIISLTIFGSLCVCVCIGVYIFFNLPDQEEQFVQDAAHDYIKSYYEDSSRLHEYADNAQFTRLGFGELQSHQELSGIISVTCFRLQNEGFFIMSGAVMHYPENYIEPVILEYESFWENEGCSDVAKHEWVVR